MSKTLFEKIAAREIPATIVYEDDLVLAIRDINPQAPHHVLFVPTRHIATLNELDAGNADLVGKLTLAAREYAERNGIADDGWRIVMNCNEGAGQSVFHIHLHLLGGRQMNWPPG